MLTVDVRVEASHLCTQRALQRNLGDLQYRHP